MTTSSPTTDDPDSGEDTMDPDGTTFVGPSSDLPQDCSLFLDDCPPGTKCMPWANDGGNSWNATKCTPIAEDANGVGEPCTVEGNGVSGIDDCEAHAMCWNVDPETNMGECVAFCTGSESEPACDDACNECYISGGSPLALCLPVCDPLAQDCGDGEGCYAVDDTFSCAPDASGRAGAEGDPCEFINVCDPGLFCASTDSLPDCADPTGCCTPFCDVEAADPCPGAGEGVECIPWGVRSPCFSATIGVCLLPS